MLLVRYAAALTPDLRGLTLAVVREMSWPEMIAPIIRPAVSGSNSRPDSVGDTPRTISYGSPKTRMIYGFLTIQIFLLQQMSSAARGI